MEIDLHTRKTRTTVVFIESHPTHVRDSMTNLHGICRAYAVFKLTLAVVCTTTAPTLLCTNFVFRLSIIMHLRSPFLRPIRNDDGHMWHGTVCRQRFVLFFIYIHENWNRIDRNRHTRRASTWRCRWSGLSVQYDILYTCYGRSLQTVETKRNIKAAVHVCKRGGGPRLGGLQYIQKNSKTSTPPKCFGQT